MAMASATTNSQFSARGLCDERPRAIEHYRVDVDRVDALCDTSERDCKQPVAATEINRDPARLDAHFRENLRGIRPQRLPPVCIGHRACREKADDHPVL